MTTSLVHLSPQGEDTTSCCGVTVAELSRLIMDERHLSVSTPEDVNCAGLCRRCGTRPGRERFYQPGPFSLVGVTPKVSVKRTVGCDACWVEFQALQERATPRDEVLAERARRGPSGPGLLDLVRASDEPPPLPVERFSGEVVLKPAWRAWTTWLPRLLREEGVPGWAWLLGWLAALVVVIVGGGMESLVSAAGLVGAGTCAAEGLRWLWRYLS